MGWGGVWVFGLHVFVAILDGDLCEGDAGRCGVAGGQHAGEVQRGVAVLQVELVHGGRELIAIARLFEERGLDVGLGDEIAQRDADEEGLLVFGVGGGLLPAALQRFEERERVLARAEAGLHAPAGLCDAAQVLLDFFGSSELCRLGWGEGVLDGDGERTRKEFFHAEAHGGFVEELVGNGPGTFRGAVFGGKDVGVAERFLKLGGDGRAIVAGIAAAQPVIHAVPPDGVEEGVHGGAI